MIKTTNISNKWTFGLWLLSLSYGKWTLQESSSDTSLEASFDTL